MKLENLGGIVFVVAIFAVASVIAFLVSWKLFVAFWLAMFWLEVNIYLPEYLENVWYNSRMKPINDEIDRRNAERAKKYHCQSDLWGDIWDGCGGFEDHKHDLKLRDELGSSAALLSYTVTTLIGGGVLVYIIFFV